MDLDPWQQDAVMDLMGEDSGGFWSATSGGLICPRQNGKGSVIEALELAWLFLCDVELIFHSAHLFATAADAYRRIKFLIRNTPDLHRQVLRYSEAHGQEGIELRSGQRLRFVARSKSGGRGFPAPVVVLDEAFNLMPQAMAAMVPTMAAQPNPFLLLASSAPIPEPCSDVLRSFMRDSREPLDRRCYIEYSADPSADEETQLRQANPGYGIRLNDDVIDEERRLLPPDLYQIERLGIVDLTSQSFRVVPEVDWVRCEHVGHKPTGPVCYSLDVDENAKGETWASIGCSDGTHLELVTPLDAGPGTGWVVGACVAKKSVLSELVVAQDSPAAALVDDLEAAGITVRRVKPDEFVEASMQLFDAVLQAGVRHLDQPALNVAVAGVQRRDVGDGKWRWSRKLSAVDIGPLCAVTLARWAVQHQDAPVETGIFDPNDEDDE